MKKIAILILAHKKPDQLKQLLIKLDDINFDFFIHIDAKSEFSLFYKSINGILINSNITWINNRVKTYFNDYSLIEATCRCAEEAMSHHDYSYFILLTGQDYPIKTNKYIYEYLLKSYPMSFIDMYGVDEAYNKGVEWVKNIGYYYFSQRIRRKILGIVGDRFYFSSRGKVVRLFAVVYDKIMSSIKYSPRQKLKNTHYIYSAGSHFWILPDTSVRFILDKYHNDKMLSSIFKHISAPEESYFQTILSVKPNLLLPNEYIQFQSQEREMDNPALRLIKWYENGIHTNGHPAIWKKEDFKFLLTADALFARKFDMDIDNDIITLIDRHMDLKKLTKLK